MANLKNLNRFEWAPVALDIQRSSFNLSHKHTTTFKSGQLIPIDLIEVLPSDTIELDLSSVCRMITPVVPTMDNAFLDVYAFFVPNRIACAHPKDWERICGENVNGFWAPVEEATLESTGNTIPLHELDILPPYSIGAYYGLPIGMPLVADIPVSTLPLNGYTKIYNEWFRDQNVQYPNSGTYDDSPFYVNKLHDYFTSCLPSPQKGAPVSLPLGLSAPVVGFRTNGDEADIFSNSDYSLKVSNPVSQGDDTYYFNNLFAKADNGDGAGSLQTGNLEVDLSSATAATINQLRQAFAIQRMLEKDARGGSRYREILRTHYGSMIPDSTIQIPQYLGGKRINLNITQVLQTSSSNETSPLGATGAFSNTSFADKLFIKSFDEHGYIHILACIRPQQTYSQGLPKTFTRNRRFDWYYPSFANLGEMPVYTRELFAGVSDVNQIFGYQEAWADYRYIPNRISGYLAPMAEDEILTAWTYTNNFENAPVLNEYFMKQYPEQIGDTLVYPDSDYQFIADFYFDIKAVRAMPTYSIPGLIDHH